MKDIRKMVQQRYGKIADESCCFNNQGISDTAVNYANIDLSALPEEAIQASLGCANPLVFARLSEGETVLDLGSGGGMDVLAASRLVGDTGKIYGLDMTDEMLQLANSNKAKMGANNAEFLKGYIEDIPLPDETIDAVISNCVINLSQDKQKALSEAYRVIKPGGRLRIADMVSIKKISPKLREDAEMWCGCLAGTITIAEYESILQNCGFSNIKIEIAHVYTKETIGIRTDLGDIDGAFAGALISADKNVL
ncbi:MAG: arsenite methyltransferase [Clostridiales bacterium]|jgi:SAM-dependent methyltransferase|nr:arsenite methyltransferase [Clostridiales bacterium]